VESLSAHQLAPEEVTKVAAYFVYALMLRRALSEKYCATVLASGRSSVTG